MMMRTISVLVFCFVLLPCHGNSMTAREDFSKLIPVMELGIRPAYLLPTNEYFQGKGPDGKPASSNFSLHFKYGFRFDECSGYGKLYPHAVQGIGLAYNTFFNSSNIGNPIALYVFQTYRIALITKKLSLDYEWNFGISFAWKEYDPKNNPNNIVVGSDANAYINFGLYLNWSISEILNLKAGAGVTHFSNGNTKYPNGGVNTLGGNLQIARSFGQRTKSKPNPENEREFKAHVSHDCVLYGATRKKGFRTDDGSAIIVPGSFAVAGMNFSTLYNFSKYFRAGLSVDAQFDESANITKHIANTSSPTSETVKFHRPAFREQFAMGISARAEVIMPIFSINMGIGRNILCDGQDTDSFYQIFALKTKLTDNLFIHIGYQVFNFKTPNNLMLGIGWSFL